MYPNRQVSINTFGDWAMMNGRFTLRKRSLYLHLATGHWRLVAVPLQYETLNQPVLPFLPSCQTILQFIFALNTIKLFL